MRLQHLTHALLIAARGLRAHDAEAAHDGRVTARRLETALSLWRPALRTDAADRARRALRRMRRSLSRVRDLEVHLAALRPMLRPLTADDARIARWLERIERRTVRARELAAERVSPSRARRVQKWIEAASENAAESSAVDAVRERLARREAAFRERAAHALESPEPERLHQARIALKKLRYALESAQGPAMPEGELRDEAAQLRAVQRTLGQIQDAATLSRRLTRRLRRWRARGHASAASRVEPLLAPLATDGARAVEALLPKLHAILERPSRHAPGPLAPAPSAGVREVRSGDAPPRAPGSPRAARRLRSIRWRPGAPHAPNG
jgi:CHAD domain-containing protein